MTRDEITAVLFEEIGNVAPEVDLRSVPDGADLRDALDIDSIGFLNLMIALDARLGIAVPEADYPRLRTIRGAVEYLCGRGTAA
ncbi:MAG: acyl carrier protein [Alphaproteobacteria bacterium]|nr:acyl carrier protein [Alphaproteobacteria bacterium]